MGDLKRAFAKNVKELRETQFADLNLEGELTVENILLNMDRNNYFSKEYQWFRLGVIAAAVHLKESGKVATQLANGLLEEV